MGRVRLKSPSRIVNKWDEQSCSSDESSSEEDSRSGDEEVSDEDPQSATMGRVCFTSPSPTVNEWNNHVGVRYFGAKPGRLKNEIAAPCVAEPDVKDGWYLENGVFQHVSWRLRIPFEASPLEVSVPKEEHQRGPARPPDD